MSLEAGPAGRPGGHGERGRGALAAARVILASALLLYAELLVVRHAGAELARLAFFKNLVLIAAFLGAGIGMMTGRERPRARHLAWPLLALFAVAIPWLGGSTALAELRFGGADEFHWSLEQGGALLDSSAFLFFFVAVFTATLLLFVGMGAIVAATLAGLPPLRAYVLNLAGSIAGVLAFAAVSALGLRPLVWYGLLVAPLVWLAVPRVQRALPRSAAGNGPRGSGRIPRGEVGQRALAACALAGSALLCSYLSRDAIWSPYSRIEVRPWAVRAGEGAMPNHDLTVNRSYFMSMADLSASAPPLAGIAKARQHYDLPYLFVTPDRVLVLGAGGGNDVAAALRSQARQVDAVEIDPVIVRLGRELHPERPYRSSAVRVHIDDARSFVAHSKERYGLVTLGLLDSHAVLSGLPGVRLDNYVYTVEALRAAYALLEPSGVLALSFAVPLDRPWIALKLARLLEQATGETPQMYAIGYDVSVAFLVGPGLSGPRATSAAAILQGRKLDAETLRTAAGPRPVDVPTDDWPHLYLRARGLPAGQLLLILLLLAVSLLASRLLVPVSGRPDPHFALLGAGFLLVETKGIADLGLLFGGTWWTVTAVLLAVLFMALLSAGLVARFRPDDLRPPYAALLLALALGWVIRPAHLLGLPLPLARLGGSLLVALPVLFSGVVFAIALRRSGDVSRALGSNLLGAVAGGFLEYASLALGVRALGLLAIAIYAAAGAAAARSARGSRATSPGTPPAAAGV